MLGGGVFVTQNKVLPGSYINFVNTTSTNVELGQRGVVALALQTDDPYPDEWADGKVVEITKDAFVSVDTGDGEFQPLREIFRHAEKVYCYFYDTTLSADDFINALEPYDINVVCHYYLGDDYDEIATKLIAHIKNWRDTLGKKVQLVVYNQAKPDHEGVINVVSTPDGGTCELVLWVAGAMAGCKINESCTNMLYDGELTIVANKTQAQLEQCIKDGQVAFHNVYGEIRLLEDINSLVTTTVDKGEDFKYNQTIRVIDQVANDIAKMFNTKYLGKIPNTESGRVSLWSDIVKHHRALEEIGAIENFDATQLTIAQGATKKSVVVNDVITVVNAMAQLYMTVVVQ